MKGTFLEYQVTRDTRVKPRRLTLLRGAIVWHDGTTAILDDGDYFQWQAPKGALKPYRRQSLADKIVSPSTRVRRDPVPPKKPQQPATWYFDAQAVV